MKKNLSVLFIVLLLLFAVPATAMAAVVASPQTVYVDGVETSFEVYNIDGNNYFKLRDIAYILNNTESQFSVSYDSAANMISVVTGASYTANGSEMQLGMDKSSTAVKSSQSLMIDGTSANLLAYNIGGNNFFQLRALAQTIDFGVRYDSIYNSVLIQSNISYQAPSVKLSAEQIYSTCSPAVFLLEVYDNRGKPIAFGSGFFIDSEGTAVTNYHVIEGAASATVTLSATGEVYQVEGIYDYSTKYDIALLKVAGSDFSYLRTGDSEQLLGGAKIYTIGSPLGLQNTISEGIISNPSRVVNSVSYIQISASISAGSSGGPLLNEYGEVIGVTTGSFTEGQNLNVAIPISYLSYLSKDDSFEAFRSVTPAVSGDAFDVLSYMLLYRGNYVESSGQYYFELDSVMDTYYIYYTPSEDCISFVDVYESEYDTMETCLYIDGIASSYYFEFTHKSNSTRAKGNIDATTISPETQLTFTGYTGIRQNQSPYENIAKYMICDSIDAAEYMFRVFGLNVSILDFGFETEYAVYNEKYS